MSNNTQPQLPAETLEEINGSAEEFAKYSDADQQKIAAAWRAGATAYATKYEAARSLLSKFISRHEAGLLPDRFIYDEIKTFLDGK
jgi:phytoene/squalene synthetase